MSSQGVCITGRSRPGSLAVQAGNGIASADAIAAAVALTPDPVAPDLTSASGPWRCSRWSGRDARRAFGFAGDLARRDPIPDRAEGGDRASYRFPEPIAEIQVPREVEQRSRLVLTPAGHLCTGPRKAPFASTRYCHVGQWIASINWM